MRSGVGSSALAAGGAALRGAVVASLVAALVVSFAVAWTTVAETRGMVSGGLSITDLPEMLLFWTNGQTPVRSFIWPGTFYLLGAALVGCVTGVIASRLAGAVRRRTTILIAISPLGPWLVAAGAVAMPPLSEIGRGGARAFGAASLMLLASMSLALPYVVMLAPLVAPPVILGHLVLEGWTRPPGLKQTGFARPGVRRRTLQVLLAAVVALATVSAMLRPPA